MSIRRFNTSARLSQAVVHGGVAYIAGQVSDEPVGKSVAKQAQNILAKVDRLLAEAGTDKSRILFASVWLSDVRFYGDFNLVWDEWVSQGNAPARACVEAALASADYLVEVSVTAALPTMDQVL
jgi:enamine deaminase RidA (YjgF/YER057c/UK114 family)